MLRQTDKQNRGMEGNWIPITPMPEIGKTKTNILLKSVNWMYLFVFHRRLFLRDRLGSERQQSLTIRVMINDQGRDSPSKQILLY